LGFSGGEGSPPASAFRCAVLGLLSAEWLGLPSPGVFILRLAARLGLQGLRGPVPRQGHSHALPSGGVPMGTLWAFPLDPAPSQGDCRPPATPAARERLTWWR